MRPRKVIAPEALAELRESIRAYGILQPSVGARRSLPPRMIPLACCRRR